jgi:hypothetical protein
VLELLKEIGQLVICIDNGAICGRREKEKKKGQK